MSNIKQILSSVWLGTSSSHDSMMGWHGGRRFGLHLNTPLLLALVRIKTRNRPSKWFRVIITYFLSRFLSHSGLKSILASYCVSPSLLFRPFKSMMTYLFTFFGWPNAIRIPTWKRLQWQICNITCRFWPFTFCLNKIYIALVTYSL